MTTQSCVQQRITSSTLTRLYRHPSSLRTPAVRPAYSIAAADVYILRGSTGHSLRRCLAPLKNSFSLPDPEFATHDADDSIFETWKEKMRRWRRRGSNRRHQGNVRRNASGNGNFPPHTRGSTSASQGHSGITHVTTVAAAPVLPPAPPSAPGPALIAAPTLRYGFSFTGNTDPDARQPGTFQVQPAPTP